MAKKDWRWTNKTLVKVYLYSNDEITKLNKNITRKKDKIKNELVARLLLGEWVKPINTEKNECYVAFRGGKGWIPKDSFGNKRVLEIYFLDVGQGDGILVQTPDDRRILIDGGRDGKAHNYLKWKYNLRNQEKPVDFHSMIVTHPDEDHMYGFVPILEDEKISVKKVYHNGIARFSKGIGRTKGKGKQKKLIELYDDVTKIKSKIFSDNFSDFVEALKIAKKNNKKLKILRLDHNSNELQNFSSDGFTVKVLGPINHGTKTKPEIRYFGSESKTLNGNSVSLMLELIKAKIFLCGDMNKIAETEFLDFYHNQSIEAQIFKANHHGSKDFGHKFLEAVRPWATVVSSGDQPDYAHPTAILLGSLGKYSPTHLKKPLVFSTEVAATFHEISDEELDHMADPRFPIYEKVAEGIIHVRTDGNNLVVGRVYGTPKFTSRFNSNGYQWECYQLDLNNPNEEWKKITK